jgi:hypothetical protein
VHQGLPRFYLSFRRFWKYASGHVLIHAEIKYRQYDIVREHVDGYQLGYIVSSQSALAFIVGINLQRTYIGVSCFLSSKSGEDSLPSTSLSN